LSEGGRSGLAPIRVLLAGRPAIRDTFEATLAGADDIDVVATATGPIDILLTVGRSRPDVVVIEIEGDQLPGVTTHLSAEYPRVKVLGVTADLRHAMLAELHPRVVDLGDVRASGLDTVVRRVAGAEAGP
jgi:DNA-binding NarL/FixJ family response regulator